MMLKVWKKNHSDVCFNKVANYQLFRRLISLKVKGKIMSSITTAMISNKTFVKVYFLNIGLKKLLSSLNTLLLVSLGPSMVW